MPARHKVPIALTIAGSDSSGGAGIEADLKVFALLGVHGASVITALTAQNTRGIAAIHPVPPAFVARQLRAVLDDLDVKAIKTGMLGGPEIVEVIAAGLEAHPDIPLVIDPVMAASSGTPLLDADALAVLKDRLLPPARLITPNLPEAQRLLGEEGAGGDLSGPLVGEADEAARHTFAETSQEGSQEEMTSERSEQEICGQHEALEGLARRLFGALGGPAVLLKGGHMTGPRAIDILFDGERAKSFSAPRIETRNSHGTGCVLSAAIAAGLAQGKALEEAVAGAKSFVTKALRAARGKVIGGGRGPLWLATHEPEGENR